MSVSIDSYSPEKAADAAANAVFEAFQRVSPWTICGDSSPLTSIDRSESDGEWHDNGVLLARALGTLGTLAYEIGFDIVRNPSKMPAQIYGDHRSIGYPELQPSEGSGLAGWFKHQIKKIHFSEEDPQLIYNTSSRSKTRNFLAQQVYMSANGMSDGWYPMMEAGLRPNWAYNFNQPNKKGYGQAFQPALFLGRFATDALKDSDVLDFTIEDVRQYTLHDIEKLLQLKDYQNILNVEAINNSTPEELESALDLLIDIARQQDKAQMIRVSAGSKNANGTTENYFGINFIEDDFRLIELVSRVVFAGIAGERDTFRQKRSITVASPTDPPITRVLIGRDNNAFTAEKLTIDAAKLAYTVRYDKDKYPIHFETDTMALKYSPGLIAAVAVKRLLGSYFDENPAQIAKLEEVLNTYANTKLMQSTRINPKLTRHFDFILNSNPMFYDIACSLAQPNVGTPKPSIERANRMGGTLAVSLRTHKVDARDTIEGMTANLKDEARRAEIKRSLRMF